MKSELLINNTKNEIVGIFDENDNYVRSATRKEMRAKNLIHRATDIIIINSQKQILVQTRSMKKEYCPGYLDAVIGGVVGDKEDVNLSAERELNEEVGIDVTKIKNKLVPFGKFLYKDNVCTCWEYEYYLILTEDEEKLITFRDHEVSSIKWYDIEELLKLIEEKKEKITGGSVQTFKNFVQNKFI